MNIFSNPLLPPARTTGIGRTEIILEVMPKHLDDTIQAIRSKYGNRNYIMNKIPPKDWYSLPDENVYICIESNNYIPGRAKGSKYIGVYDIKEMKARAIAQLEAYLERQRKENECIDKIVKEAKEKYPDDYQGMVDYITRGLYRMW